MKFYVSFETKCLCISTTGCGNTFSKILRRSRRGFSFLHRCQRVRKDVTCTQGYFIVIRGATASYAGCFQTSDRFREAGTIAAVCVKIVGRENSSKWKVLDYFFKNDFTRGSTETYTVTNCDDAIGPPVMLHFSEPLFFSALRLRSHFIFLSSDLTKVFFL